MQEGILFELISGCWNYWPTEYVSSDFLEQEFRRRTVGLVTAEEFRKAREFVDENSSKEGKAVQDELKIKEKIRSEKNNLKRKKMAAALSFNMEGDDQGN